MLRYHCCVAVLLSVLLGVPASARSAPLVTLTPQAQATLAFVFGEPENDDASREDDGDDDDGDEDAEIANDRELPGDDDDDGNDESSEAGDRESECEEEEEEGDGEKEQRTGEGDTDDESERAESDGDSDRENEDGEETGDDSRHEREGREEAGDDDGEDREEGGREQVEDEPEESGERNDDAAETVRVFTLAHTSSAATARLVQQLYARQRVAVAEDSRTNTVVLRANPRLLDEIEAVIQKVDSARAATSEISAQRQSGDEGALQVKPGAGMSATMALRMREAMNGAGGATLLRQEFQRLDVQSARTAAALRELQTAGGKDGSDSRLANLRQQLVTEISAAFDARQRLHQLELSLLKERVARLQQAVTSREQIREAIIERRAQDLLNPTLLWPAENPASQPVDPGAQTSATAEPAATTPAERERSAASPDSASLRKTPRELRDEIEGLKLTLEARESDVRQFPDHPGVRAGLVAVQDRINRGISELDAQLEFVRLDLEDTRLICDAKAAEYDRARQLMSASIVSPSELANAKLAFDRAQLAVKRAQKVYDLYLKIWPPSDAAPAETGGKSNGSNDSGAAAAAR